MPSTFFITLVANPSLYPLDLRIIKKILDICHIHEFLWLAKEEAIDIPCKLDQACLGTDYLKNFHNQIKQVVNRFPIDVFLTSENFRRKQLLVADMDATIVKGETLDELATEVGIGEKIAAITARAMNGELVFDDALKERVALLKGISTRFLEKTWDKVQLNPGATTLIATMHKHHAYTALISGGFTFFTERVAKCCGFDENIANSFRISHNQLDGTVIPPIVGKEAKLFHLNRLQKKLSIPSEASLAIGDGANDIPMLTQAGLGIAYHPKPVVSTQINNQIQHSDLRAILYAQGYPASDFVEP